ncbi:MAG: hypothetical protein HZA74_13650 [Ignavibacteriales bacterium]|nr:hypothetical protein [Ignavibacteriales bacterium]
MKKLLIFFLMLISLRTTFAQEGEDVGWVARFGAAGGFSPTLVFPNVDAVNTQVKIMGLENLSGKGMIVYGGGGYAYIMLVDNLRIGGIGLSGTQSSKGTINGFNKEVKYNYGLGGFTAEYTLPFIKNIAVSVGAIIGAGSSSIEIFQNQNNFSWNGIWNEVNSKTTQNIYRKITNSFLTITPTLNVDIPLSRFIAFRIGGGYITSLANSWKVDNEQDFGNVPSDLSSSSFFIQTGIYFGLIAF